MSGIACDYSRAWPSDDWKVFSVEPAVNGLVGCFELNAPLRQISVCVGPSPREREKEKRNDR